MLRALLWIEWRATWWWWLLILLPYGATWQLKLLTGDSAAAFETMWMAPIIAGLGIASGMRDRQGSRASLSRHGAPWQILLAKLLVPAVMMPLYDLAGLSLSHDVISRSLNFSTTWYNPHKWEYGFGMLIPLFIAGLATGLRQARWWGTRLAPLIATVTLLMLAQAMMQWRWGERGYLWTGLFGRAGEIDNLIAVLVSLPAVAWSLASLRAARGEDGPGTRVAAGWCVGIAMLGGAMAPWVYLDERWEGILIQRASALSSAGSLRFYEPRIPSFSLVNLLYAAPAYTIAPTGFDGFGIVRLTEKTYVTYHGTPHTIGVQQANGTYTDDPVIIQGMGDADGPTTLAQAWTRLDMDGDWPAIRQQWHHLRINTNGDSSGRFIQWGEHEPPRAQPGRHANALWSIADDPLWATAPGHQPARRFQLDTWSGPVLVLRPLTAADPPLLYRHGDLHVGIWADHLSWSAGDHPPIAIAHPFPADTDAAINLHSFPPVTWVTYRWRATPWAALRWTIAVVGHDGVVLSRTEMPSADDSRLLQGLSLLGSPLVATLGLAINRTVEIATNRPWSSPVDLPWTLVGACLALAATWWMLARREVPVRARWGWLLMALAGGFAVPLAVIAVWHPMARRACPSCRRLRWADDIRCPGCGAGWGQPMPAGHEISDAAPTAPESAPAAASTA